MTLSEQSEAKVFYIVGASGSGKDSLIRGFRELLRHDEAPIVSAHRYITRENTIDEGSVYLSEPEFLLRERNNFFSMSWQANGLHYGVGTEIHQWLNSGYSVLVNGSRAYLPKAKEKYGDHLHSILVDVPEKMLRQRLQARARESDLAIESRLDRHRELKRTISCDSEVSNENSIETGASQLKAIIFSTMASSTSKPEQSMYRHSKKEVIRGNQYIE